MPRGCVRSPALNVELIRRIGIFRFFARAAFLRFRKRVLRRDTMLRLPTGRQMILPRSSQNASEVYVSNANIDWGSEALFASFANADGDLLDVGAHIGYYSVYLSPLVRRAYAFEPDPRNIVWLQKNANLAGNIEVVALAVSSTNGTAMLHMGPVTAVSSLETVGGGSDDMPVATTTVDAFVSSRPDIHVTLMKTDVEGHDLHALQGARETVARHQPLILTECNDAMLAGLCDAWDYAIFAFTRNRRTQRTRFVSMSQADLRDKYYKMLFLVPPRLKARFAEEAVTR